MKYYFILSPSLAVLDSWNPVISKLLDYKIKIVCVIPSYRVLKTIDSKEKRKLLNTKFNSLIFLDGDRIKEFGSYEDLNSKVSLFYVKDFVLRIFLRLGFKKKSYLINKTYNNWFRDFHRFKQSIILMDIDYILQEKINDLIQMMNHKIIFSLSHGLNIKISNRKAIDLSNYRLKVFAHSSEETKYYQKVFCLKKNQIIVTGIPRHDNNWLKKIVKPNFNLLDGSLLIISRPYNTHYFTKNEKNNALKSIKKLSSHTSKKLIFKLHPKGEKLLQFFGLFGIKSFRKNWEFYHDLGIPSQKISMAICLHNSGVIKDLVMLGIPTVIMAQETVFEKWPDSIHKSNGFIPQETIDLIEPLHRFVNTYDDLKKAYDEPYKILNDQTIAYFNYFYNPNGSINKILKEILEL